MANRMIDNVILVESAMGNLSVVGGASSTITNFHISTFAFRSTNTGGVCIFTGADTTDIVAHFDVTAHIGSGGLIANPQTITFSKPLRLNSLKVPTISNGTGWVYLA